MDMEHHFNCVPIPIDEGRICNMTFDGCHYYFVLQEEIIKTDLSFHILCRYRISREYNQICYDWKQKYFWVSSSDHHNIIYKLDCKMNEIDCVTLRGCPNQTGPITGLSYECYCNKIMISFEKTIVQMGGNGECKRCLYMPNLQIIGLLSLCPGCILITMKGDRQCLYLWPPNECPREIYCAEQGVSIINLIFNPCCSGEPKFDCLTLSQGKPPHMCHIPLYEMEIGYHPLECNYQICKNCCENTEPKPINCNDILESIALEEAAIAHILNAEGEKIQKILAITNDFDKIMCVNQEVNETIINVTILEQTLYAKLIAVSKICPFEQAQPCCQKEQ